MNLTLPNNQTRLLYLDLLRTLAAVYILLHHAQYLVWNPTLVSSGFENCHNLSNPCYWFLFGRQVLLFFFVLSGFVIAYTHSHTHKPSFSKKTFLVRRVNRLLPELVFVLILTSSLDYLAIFFSFPSYLNQSNYPDLNRLAASAHQTLTQNLTTFTTQPKWPIWGTNHPLWMLRYEWLAYIVFTFWRDQFTHKKTVLGLVLIAAFTSLAFTSVFPTFIAESFLLIGAWSTGALLALHYQHYQHNLTHLKWLSLTLIPLILRPEILTSRLNPTQHDWLWILAWLGILSITLTIQKPLSKNLKRLTLLGNELSYPLYLTHYPVYLFLSGWYLSINTTLPKHLGLLFFSSFICLIIAHTISGIKKTINPQSRIMNPQL